MSAGQASSEAVGEQADGEPVGCDLEYWLRAEQEIVNQSVAGEEDPLAAADQGAL